MTSDDIIRSYKKREKKLQRRLSEEHGVNKRLVLLLKQCDVILPNGILKESVNHELIMLKYKYK